ncbi:hypothetical protein CBS147343_5157 [Aspergillus niger]|uniref:C2H2-type zinc finger protein n=1 Tax=Aspergillus lacticoffeatus (strain CBS 101883) TaxID=1450533 RepID=UPI000D7F92C8|nr:uncharacterized protein BO96DRAFT_413936 [Aspergillus niger CBS 101883]KAI2842542.1 hypothetical protein CBS11350_5808 [Aspergillus niger]KAI2897844.1 hypothetical protein CBS11852_3855 [Aspergillus niger]KAI2941383.1 hypothetical protein CBS147321_5822 [Aspergillus niger]KAI2954635.1 hypothetical protein CBS147322_3724 [Aspergillus niger]KAI3072822.1 hypothetical protein CBS147343_5157 [Aspergillus niger]
MAEAFEDSTKLAEDWLTYRTDQSTLDPNLGFVELFYQTCSAALVHLWRSHFRSTIRGSHRNTLKKDVANIDLWEENFPIGHLDTILGRSQPLKLNVIENLKGIGNVLRPYFAIYDSSTHAGNGRDVAQDLGQELVTQLEKAVIILDEAASDSSSDDDSSDNSSESSESEYNRFGRLHCYVNCLMELVPVIERNISRLKKEEQSQHVPLQSEFRLSQDAQPFAMRIRDRFLSASTLLVERLAEANLERSIRIRENEVDDEVLDALTLFKPDSQFCDSAIGTSLAPTSRYAATTASHTSFLSVTGDEGKGRPRVPPLPVVGGTFRCYYCGDYVSMPNRIYWKMHVYSDLESYLCTHEDCRDSFKTFRSRKSWMDHEYIAHFSQFLWRCCTCNYTAYAEREFIDHLVKVHSLDIAGSLLKTTVSRAEERVLKPQFKDHKCALCLESGWKSKKEYATHVGRHLEEVSLACLPIEEEEVSDVDSNADRWTNATNGSGHEAEIIDETSEDDYALAYPKLGREIFGVSHPSKRTPSKGSKSLSLENLPSSIQQFQFKCKEPGCKARFKRQEHLRRHMKSHSKEKPQVCWVPGCHRAFPRSDSLNAHYTKTHSKRGGRNRYVATLDENSSDYNPEYRGPLTPDGRPIWGSKLEDPNPDCGNLSVEGQLPVAEPETYEIPVGKNLLNTAKPPVSPGGGP